MNLRLFSQSAIAQTPMLLGLLVGLGFFSLRLVGFGFEYFPGDLGDGRFNLYLLEHCHLFFTGCIDSFWDASFMFPEKNTLAISDNLIGSAPIYSLFRMFGLGMFSAYQGWFLVVSALNYLSAFLFLNSLFKNRQAAALGAFLFAFSIALHSQLLHAQTFPRFAIPLAFWALIQFRTSFSPRFFLLFLTFTIYQLFCGIYLGLMLGLLSTILMVLVLGFESKRFLIQLKNQRWVIQIMGSLALLMIPLILLMWPYIQQNNAGPRQTFQQISSTIPTLSSYYTSTPNSFSWKELSFNIDQFDVIYDHQIFMGLIATLCLIIAAVAFLLFIFRQKVQETNNLLTILAIGGFIFFLLFLRVGNFSLYYIVYQIPGFSAMRSLTRVINLELVFASIAVAWIYLRIIKKTKSFSKLIFMLILTLLVLDNYISDFSSVRTAITESTSRTESLINRASDLKQGSIFSYEPATHASLVLYDQIDAMLVAQQLHLKTVNAYTATYPAIYQPFESSMDSISRNFWLVQNPASFDSIFIINESKNAKLLRSADLPDLKYLQREMQNRRVKAMVHTIMEDSFWMESIKEKAAAQHLDLDSMVKIDAQWMIDRQ